LTDDRSPLQEIEQAVQARARELALDTDDDTETMRALVDDAVSQWSLDHKRGLRAFDLADPAAVADRAVRNLTGYGPLAPLLADDDVWEIMVADLSFRGPTPSSSSGTIFDYP